MYINTTYLDVGQQFCEGALELRPDMWSPGASVAAVSDCFTVKKDLVLRSRIIPRVDNWDRCFPASSVCLHLLVVLPSPSRFRLPDSKLHGKVRNCNPHLDFIIGIRGLPGSENATLESSYTGGSPASVDPDVKCPQTLFLLTNR